MPSIARANVCVSVYLYAWRELVITINALSRAVRRSVREMPARTHAHMCMHTTYDRGLFIDLFHYYNTRTQCAAVHAATLTTAA